MPAINTGANGLISLHFPDGSAESPGFGGEPALAGGQSFAGVFGNLLQSNGEPLPPELANQQPQEMASAPWQMPLSDSDDGMPGEATLAHSFSSALHPSSGEQSGTNGEAREDAEGSGASLFALVSSQIIRGHEPAGGKALNQLGTALDSPAARSADVTGMAAQPPLADNLLTEASEDQASGLTETDECILTEPSTDAEVLDAFVRKSSTHSEPVLASTASQTGSTVTSSALGIGLAAPTQAVASTTVDQYSIDSLTEPNPLERELEAARFKDAEERLEFGSDKSLWGQQLGSRILTMVAEDVQQARIHLDPPELGSLEIQLSLDKSDELRLQIQTQSPQVRDVLEAQAHRLRESLSEQGMALAEFDVRDMSQRGDHSGQGADDGREQDNANESENRQALSGDLAHEDALAAGHSQTAHQGLVSTFV